MASHLHCSLQETKAKTSSSDFVLWKEYLKQKELDDANSFPPLYQYLAQIALEVRRGFIKNPDKIGIEEFRKKFRRAGTDDDNQKPKATLEMEKSYWKAAVGYRPPHKKLKKRKS